MAELNIAETRDSLPPPDPIEEDGGSNKGAIKTSDTKGSSDGRQSSKDLNKELPLNPAERAGLKAQKRNYTKEISAAQKPEIDPNHAYPNVKDSTTLILCMSPLFIFAVFFSILV